MIRQRCAIYTRKSTEEGLDQDFNSLDAQREACAAYILSQKHEGWFELGDRYDDGGLSGGSMKRPGLKRLLGDVEAGRIDVIVVYKVDRLTRSLADFAKMVDVFDGAGVSFVSVTQAFNTTSSMGRLTLNVLLSFAQFEREVTAERIRDKVAASKRKGMWMGGAVPMGYDVKDKALVVNEHEARSIRTIFAEYIATGSVRELSTRLNEQGLVSKLRTDRHGRTTGGEAFSRGALYTILRNPVYIDRTRHKDAIYDGLHQAIIDEAIWQNVQALLADHGGRKIKTQRRPAKRPLDGLLYDTHGRAMRTTYASKNVRQEGATQTKRYWYYTSKPTGDEARKNVERLPAGEIEYLVFCSLKDRLGDKAWLVDQIAGADVAGTPVATIIAGACQLRKDLAADGIEATSKELGRLVARIDLQKDRLKVHLNLHALVYENTECGPILGSFEAAFEKRQKGRAKPIVIVPKDAPQPDPDLIALIADARRWASELLDGSTPSISTIETREGLRNGSVSRILPLAWLAPDISTAILDGHQPAQLTAKTLRTLPGLPLDWENQRRVLGFTHQ